MFWGCALKESKAYKTQSVLEDNDYPVLHISNVALPKNAPNGKIYLQASMGANLKDLTLATLIKDKVESVALDLYVNVSQQVVLSVSGPQGAELHLSGFFEPQREGDDEGMFMDGEDDEEIDEEDVSDEDEKAGKNLNKSL
jgi:Nucleoplasmin-like domain